MAHLGARKILLVCPWVAKLPTGQPFQVVRVDFPAAMRAALVIHRFDAAFYIETPSLPHDIAEACVREHAPRLALTVIHRLDQLATEVSKRQR